MKNLIVILTLCSLFAMPLVATAATIGGDPVKEMETFKTSTGYTGTKTLTEVIGNVIKIVLTLVGIITVIIIVYAGSLWMTAGGNEDQVKKAKQWLKNAVIGLALILAAYAIADFAVSYLFAATTT